MKRRGLLSPLLILSVITGCTVHTVREEYPKGVEMPSAYSIQGGEAEVPDRWWESFGDHALNGVMAEVLEDNPTLQQAWARLEQAEALARQAGSFKYPEISGEAGASRGRTTFKPGGDFGEIQQESDLFILSVAATYEVDLWGRIKALVSAAELGVRASREDLETIAMTLASQVAETWFGIAEQRSQLSLIEEQLGLGKTFLALVELRFSLGQAAAVDVYQQRLQVASTQSQVPLVEAQLAVLENRLAVLTGRAPGDLPASLPESLPPPPPLPELGLPSDLLQQRPDVKAAHLRIQAADHRLGAAIADLYPALRLGGSVGFQWREIEKVFDNWVYQLAVGLAGPIYDGGRRGAEVDRKKALLEELLQRYREVLLGALREVNDALVLEDRQGSYLVDLDGQIALSKKTLERSRFRYGSGLSDYLPVITVLQALQGLQRTEVNARRQNLSYRIQLHRALGGDWAKALEPADPVAGSQLSGDIP
jgi:NodT family efflux transporter outer membrane factor (OMF) lipoprotein